MIQEIGRRLKTSNLEREYLVFIIANHLRPLSLYTAQQKQTLRRRGVARFFIKCAKFATDILVLALADMAAKKSCDRTDVEAFRRFVEHLQDQHRKIFQPMLLENPLITGHDLINRLNLTPSPLFKIILTAVQEHRLAGKITTRQEALALANRMTEK